MSSRRAQKVAEAIREVVSMAILADLKDPRVQDVTVTYVEVSGDLRHAKVHVSVMGDEPKQRLSLRGLKSAAGFLQSRCARRIDMRFTPRIEFVLDQGVKRSIEISQILDRVLPQEGAAHPEAGDSARPADETADSEQDRAGPSEPNEPPRELPSHPPDPARPPS
jgi:ribosome-binding factor A